MDDEPKLVDELVDGRPERAPVELDGSERGWQKVGERVDVPLRESAVLEARF